VPKATRANLPGSRASPAPIDMLLTQFSYAAWKGGRANAHFRQLAARRKLETIAAQIRALKPLNVIRSRASCIFPTKENSYLNDHVIVRGCRDAISAAGAEAAILFPGDTWDSRDPRDNVRHSRPTSRSTAISLPAAAAARRQRPAGAACREFAAYRGRVFTQNSPGLIRLLRRLPALGAFHPVTIRLTDLGSTVGVSVVMASSPAGTARPRDVAMHSSSLSFVFNTPFGFRHIDRERALRGQP